ncbi:hypothetical protein [Arthrobacter bambusae]|uniref:Uncharacterized protein n=1 Tax=Arthrobacter bambusae TaxID=1338426 RepID=A0AAW8DHV9_9MICC|nr:hypothetical protein [Arthrobacter bambusae]MDP9905571.1 hypothetical protein [Arthrobacter bambusae]MDQ0127347.1 hypothetical protein [Arthrobacter bambusae]MDQ0178689.1 hypothetical protein [Arthrobacter bambusae]
MLAGLLDGERVDATGFSVEAWSELQQSDQRKRRMVLPQCGVRAIARTRGASTR